MRDCCLSCCKKHIAQAIVLLCESKKGYPLHKWLALGHLAEAEDETSCKYPAFANRIRKARIEIEEDKYEGNLLDIIEEALLLEFGEDK